MADFARGEKRFVIDDVTTSPFASSPEISEPLAKATSMPSVRSSPISRLAPTPQVSVRARNGESR